MMVSYKDKDGTIHVGPVSESEGERINREVASMGYATPPGPEDERKVNQEWVERMAYEENPELAHVGRFEVDVANADNEELNEFLFRRLGMNADAIGEVGTRILRQVCRCFYGISFNDFELSPPTVALRKSPNALVPSKEAIEAERIMAEENKHRSRGDLLIAVPIDPEQEFPLTIFKDILFNSVHGKGSILELLQLKLADAFLDCLLLFREGAIGIESLKAEISGNNALTDFDLWTPNFEDDDEAQQRFLTGFDFAEVGRKWVPNIMLKKALPFWRVNKFDFYQIDHDIAELDEQALRQTLLTDEFLQSLPEASPK